MFEELGPGYVPATASVLLSAHMPLLSHGRLAHSLMSTEQSCGWSMSLAAKPAAQTHRKSPGCTNGMSISGSTRVE